MTIQETTTDNSSNSTAEDLSDDSPAMTDIALGSDDTSPKELQSQPKKTMHLRWTNLNKFIEIGNTDNRASLTARSSIHSKITPSAKKSTKVILDHVSGEAKPGEILALMVSSQRNELNDSCKSK